MASITTKKFNGNKVTFFAHHTLEDALRGSELCGLTIFAGEGSKFWAVARRDVETLVKAGYKVVEG